MNHIWVNSRGCYLDEMSKYERKVLKKYLTEKRTAWLATKSSEYAFTDKECEIYLSLKLG